MRLTVRRITESVAMKATSGSVGCRSATASLNPSPTAAALPVLSTQVVPESVDSATFCT